MGVTIGDARAMAAALPRSYEALVRDEVRFRVGRIVYSAFYHDDTIMGFAFPRDEREALVALKPDNPAEVTANDSSSRTRGLRAVPGRAGAGNRCRLPK